MSSIPHLAAYSTACVTGNWWFLLVAVYHSLLNVMLQRSGRSLAEAGGWMYLLLDPLTLWQLTMCGRTTLEDLAKHRANPG